MKVRKSSRCLCSAAVTAVAVCGLTMTAEAQLGNSILNNDRPVDAAALAKQVEIGPIAGLTTTWHQAPQQGAVPLGTVLQLRVPVDATAQVTWVNAVPGARDASYSYALAPCTTVGHDLIEARIAVGNQRTNAKFNVEVVDINVSDIQISAPQIVSETFSINENLTGADLNRKTMGHYFGGSIAGVTQLDDMHWLTSIGKNFSAEVTVTPAAFENMVEWSMDGVIKSKLGRTTMFGAQTIGDHVISAGISGERTATVTMYEVVITSHNVQPVFNHPNNDYFPQGQKILVEAVTIPAGYEEHITWMTSTMFGTGHPVTGSGPSFVCQFEDTYGTYNGERFQWLGVKADNLAMGQDQKVLPCCFNDGTCQDGLLVTECQDMGGSPQFQAETCADVSCPIQGACCFDDGSCTEGSQASCDAAGGTYQGDQTDCVTSECPIIGPPNDECDGRIEIFDGATPFDLTLATDSADATGCDPFPFPAPDGNTLIPNDVWFNYTATCNGTLFVDTCGVDGLDTRIAIYDGCACPTGTPLECNDDHGNADEMDTGLSCPGTFEASLSVQVTAGNCYKIRVGTFDTGTPTGPDTLNILCVEGGACCLPDGSCVQVADQGACDAQGGQYNGDGSDCSFALCGGACCFSDASCQDVGFESDCDALGGFYQGDGTDCASIVCPPPPAMNDTCDTAQAVQLPFNGTADNSSSLPGAPAGSCNLGSATVMQNDIWYSFVAAADGTVNINIDELGGYDALVAVYDGSCTALNEIGCGDEPEPIAISVPVTAGQTYWVQVGDWGTAPGGGTTVIDIN